jgi:hypothetical protein
MPMSDNGFKWRPNDNSAKTNLRYTLEAEKWISAVSSAQSRSQSRSFSKDLAVIGMVIQLILNVFLLILIGILMLIKSVIYFIESKITSSRNTESKTEEKTDFSGSTVKLGGDRSFLQYIFYNRYMELREIWQFLYLAIFIFIIEIVCMHILGQFWPEHFELKKDSLIFLSGVSIFFAFTGMGD